MLFFLSSFAINTLFLFTIYDFLFMIYYQRSRLVVVPNSMMTLPMITATPIT